LKKPKRKGKEETADSFPIVAIEVEHEMTFNHSQNKDDKKRNTKRKESKPDNSKEHLSNSVMPSAFKMNSDIDAEINVRNVNKSNVMESKSTINISNLLSNVTNLTCI